MKKIKGHFWGPSNPSRPSVPSNKKIEIAFNFIREIPLKMNRTKILHRVPVYLRNPFKLKSTSILLKKSL